MKTKKTKKANLENFRTIFFQIGIVLTLSAILFAFEWKSSVEIEELGSNIEVWDEFTEVPPITMPQAEVKEVKPPSFEFVVTDDGDDIEEVDLDIFDAEADQLTAIYIDDFEDEPEEVDDEIYVSAQFMPTFQGKEAKYFRAYISENLRFPAKAIDHGVSGTVIASFVINKDGSLSNIVILRGVDPVIDKAVVEAIKGSPKWDPGINNGKYVNVKYSIAIKFELL